MLLSKIKTHIIFLIGQNMHEKTVTNFKRNKCAQGMVYVIRRFPGAGFYSDFFYVISHVNYAHSKGLKTIVDMEHYPTCYKEKKAVAGQKNAWEYYFTQPDGLSVSDIKNYKKVVLSENLFKWGLAPCYVGGGY